MSNVFSLPQRLRLASFALGHGAPCPEGVADYAWEGEGLARLSLENGDDLRVQITPIPCRDRVDLIRFGQDYDVQLVGDASAEAKRWLSENEDECVELFEAESSRELWP